MPDDMRSAFEAVGGIAVFQGHAETEDFDDAVICDSDVWTEVDIPHRRWVVPGYAMRGAVTVVIGPPGALKSGLTLAWACSTALGRPHGGFVPARPGTTFAFNAEDDSDEQRRRISAALRQFDAIPADIHGRIIRATPRGVGTLLERDKDGQLVETRTMKGIRAMLNKCKPDIFIADPLAELHNCDENSNIEIRAVIAAFRALAVEYDMAVILVHHTRKGTASPGDPDIARGASAIIGAARVVMTLTPMSEDDADALGLPRDRKSRSRYIRLDDGKQNYAAIEDARWYEKALYTLDNGEVVPAAVPWVPPDMWAELSTSTINHILDRIEDGPGDGQRYSPAPQSRDRAAWPLVREAAPNLTEKQAKAVISTWLKSGLLTAQAYDDPEQRRQRQGLFVNDTKRPGARF